MSKWIKISYKSKKKKKRPTYTTETSWATTCAAVRWTCCHVATSCCSIVEIIVVDCMIWMSTESSMRFCRWPTLAHCDVRWWWKVWLVSPGRTRYDAKRHIVTSHRGKNEQVIRSSMRCVYKMSGADNACNDIVMDPIIARAQRWALPFPSQPLQAPSFVSQSRSWRHSKQSRGWSEFPQGSGLATRVPPEKTKNEPVR